MNKSTYLNRKVQELENCEKEISKRQIRNLARFIAATIPTVALAFGLGKYFMLYKAAATVGVMASLLVAGAHFDYSTKKNSINQLRDEKKHLENIKIRGINSNKELDKKRLERIVELQQQQEEINKKGIKTGIISAISGITAGVGALGILFNPLIGGIVSGISFLTATSLASDDLEGERKYNKLETRINNLKNDIELGSIYGRDEKSKQNVNSKSEASHSNQNSYTKTKQPPNGKNTQSKLNKKQEETIDDYLAYLSAMQTKEKNKVNQKVK